MIKPKDLMGYDSLESLAKKLDQRPGYEYEKIMYKELKRLVKENKLSENKAVARLKKIILKRTQRDCQHCEAYEHWHRVHTKKY